MKASSSRGPAFVAGGGPRVVRRMQRVSACADLQPQECIAIQLTLSPFSVPREPRAGLSTRTQPRR